MVSRRDLLRLGATAAVSSVLPPAARAAEQTAPLPPSIQTLQSMRDQVVPVSNEERRHRIARARQLMQQNRLDAIFMIGGTSLLYFANIRWWNSERLGALVLPVKGDPFFVCPTFEQDRLRE